MLNESLTSANLENDHGFIIKENTFSIGLRHFGKPKAKSRELILKVDNIVSMSVIPNCNAL